MREKQIEEMALELCRPRNIVKAMHHRTCGNCETSACDIYELCVDLYNAGYRKQSEGEWIKINPNNLLIGEYYCSCCNDVIDIADGRETPLDRKMYYCPNCGAKMKGGEE